MLLIQFCHTSNERCYTWDIEQIFTVLRKAAEKHASPVTQHVYVGDLGGFLWSTGPAFVRNGVPLLKGLAEKIEQCYPEIVCNIILINTPYVVWSLFNLVRAFLDPVTAAKIEMHKGVPHARFLQLMPSQSLPIEYGGTCATEFPHCRPWAEVLATQQKQTPGSPANATDASRRLVMTKAEAQVPVPVKATVSYVLPQPRPTIGSKMPCQQARFNPISSSSWKDSTICESCHAPFKLLRRKHHCRRCGHCICESCSTFSSAEGLRICMGCSRVVGNNYSRLQKKPSSPLKLLVCTV